MNAAPLQQDHGIGLLASDDARLLTELGFHALGSGARKDARVIFSGLLCARPQRAFPYIGLALTYLDATQADEAVRVLQSAGAVQENERAEIDAFLGLALKLAGRSRESTEALEKAAHADLKSDAVELARRMLGYDTAAELNQSPL